MAYEKDPKKKPPPDVGLNNVASLASLYARYGAPSSTAAGVTASAPYGVLTDAAGNAVGTAAGPTLTGATSIAGRAVPGLAGLAGAYDVLSNDYGKGRSTVEGAASGAGIGFAVGGPVGAGIGAGIGGIVGLGKSVFSGGESHLEEKMRADLAKKGINISNPDVKLWELNPQFRETRNESDLRGTDITSSAALNSLEGYQGLSPEQQAQVGEEALKRKLIREHNGGISLQEDQGFLDFYNTLKTQRGSLPASNLSSGVNPPKPKRKERSAERIKNPVSLSELFPFKNPDAPIQYDNSKPANQAQFYLSQLQDYVNNRR